MEEKSRDETFEKRKKMWKRNLSVPGFGHTKGGAWEHLNHENQPIQTNPFFTKYSFLLSGVFNAMDGCRNHSTATECLAEKRRVGGNKRRREIRTKWKKSKGQKTKEVKA